MLSIFEISTKFWYSSSSIHDWNYFSFLLVTLTPKRRFLGQIWPLKLMHNIGLEHFRLNDVLSWPWAYLHLCIKLLYWKFEKNIYTYTMSLDHLKNIFLVAISSWFKITWVAYTMQPVVKIVWQISKYVI